MAVVHHHQIIRVAVPPPPANNSNKKLQQHPSQLVGIPVQHVNMPARNNINNNNLFRIAIQQQQQQIPAAAAAVPSGPVVVGDYYYNPTDFLGRGAFGAVYRGYSRTQRDQPVAIKVVSKRNMPMAATKEARIHQQLQHENLVRLLQVKDTPTHLYLVMEYCQTDLSEHLPASAGAYYANAALLASRETFLRNIVRQLAHGLQALKAKGIVHRDLKPQNILVNTVSAYQPVQIKIADFGVSRFLPCGAMAATFCGTIAYMAPEVMLGQPYDCKADLWSLGVIIYQMLTGRMPFPQIDELSLNELKGFYTKIGGLSKTDVPRGTSAELTSLLCRLIRCNASERLSLEKLLEHPFITKSLVVKKPLATPTPSPVVTVNGEHHYQVKKIAYAQYLKNIK